MFDHLCLFLSRGFSKINLILLLSTAPQHGSFFCFDDSGICDIITHRQIPLTFCFASLVCVDGRNHPLLE